MKFDTNKSLSSLLFEEETNDKETLGKTQDISKNDINILAKAIGQTFDKSMLDLKDLAEKKPEDLEKTYESPMGSLSTSVIKAIEQKKNIVKGVGLEPVNIGDQDNKMSQRDYSSYSNIQLVPFWAKNQDGHKVSAGDGDKNNFYVCFFVPSNSVINNPKVIKLFNALWPSTPNQPGFAVKDIEEAAYALVPIDELEEFTNALKAPNFSYLTQVARDSKKRIAKCTNRETRQEVTEGFEFTPYKNTLTYHLFENKDNNINEIQFWDDIKDAVGKKLKGAGEKLVKKDEPNIPDDIAEAPIFLTKELPKPAKELESEIVQLLATVDKEFNNKLNSINSDLNKDSGKTNRQIAGFGVGGLIGAAAGAGAVAKLGGVIGLLAFGPAAAVVAGGAAALSAGALAGGLGKKQKKQATASTIHAGEAKKLVQEFLKLLHKQILSEETIDDNIKEKYVNGYADPLASFHKDIFEDETEKTFSLDWSLLEKVLQTGFGPYKEMAKGEVKNETLDEIKAFSNALVNIFEKNEITHGLQMAPPDPDDFRARGYSKLNKPTLTCKIEKFPFKMTIEELQKKREEAAKKAEQANLDAKMGEPINKAFASGLDALLENPDLSTKEKNVLNLLKVLNLIGGDKAQSLTSELVGDLIKNASEDKEFNLKDSVTSAFDISDEELEDLLENNAYGTTSLFTSANQIKSFVNYYKNDTLRVSKKYAERIKTHWKNAVGESLKNYDPKINVEMAMSKNQDSDLKLFSKIDKNSTEIIMNTYNPVTALLLTLFVPKNSKKDFLIVLQEFMNDVKQYIDTIGEFEYGNSVWTKIDDAKKDNLCKNLEQVYDEIILYADNISRNIGTIDLNDPNDIEKEDNKEIFGLQNEVALKRNNLLREEWLRIWEIKK